MNEWVPPTVPGGGGFSISHYTLEYLYEQYELHNNIWTHSNVEFDLCRYTGCKIIFFRHPTTDFIVQYQRTYPMIENSHTPATTHPLNLLLTKHHIIIPSRITKPYGKNYIKKKIKPPTQQSSKWFFTRDFSKTPVLLLKAAACDLNYVKLGRQSENNLTNIYSLNYLFYSNGAFAQKTGTKNVYTPITTQNYESGWITGTNKNYKPDLFQTNMQDNYLSSVHYDTGWFNYKVLTSDTITKPRMQAKPVHITRYNPALDTGKGNRVWLKSIFHHEWTPPQTEPYLMLEDEPLWLALFGWFDYIDQLKPGYDIYNKYTLVIQCQYIRHPAEMSYIVPVDESFLQGKNPFGATVASVEKDKWYPTLKHQQNSINNIVKCGPFIPRPEGKISNWELHLKYSFFFKWGGSNQTEQPVLDPTKGSKYPVPDNFSKTIQIADPTKQIPQAMLHTWDYRRHFITKKSS